MQLVILNLFLLIKERRWPLLNMKKHWLASVLEKATAPHSSTLAWKIPWVEQPGKGPWGHKESDTTERLPFHCSLSCIGEGNGNPLQCSCLENPRDREAWWAAVHGVAQSRTRLKRLISSSSSSAYMFRRNRWVTGAAVPGDV